ncbi:hypothetical protein OQA88_9426 [Cercophora sp. LCS_1]
MRLLTLLVAATATAWATSTRLPPSQDPWYKAPKNFEKSSPGEILRIRAAPDNFSSTIPHCSAAYHILYRTTDTRFRPSWAVTTLLLPSPYTPSSAPATPLLSYQIPYNSVDIDSSPSYDNAAMTPPTGPVASALSRGWLVVIPDFEGPTASYGAGVQAGHATLDSLRAVLTLSREPKPHKRTIGLITRYALWGYSGGSIATGFAAELSVQYAPELSETIAGAALGGLAANITSPALDGLNETTYVGLLFALLLGTTNQYPDAYNFVVDSLKETGPYNRTGFLAVGKMTVLEAWANYAGQDIWAYFEQGEAVAHDMGVQRAFWRNAVMGYHGVPRMPLFVYHAVGDRFVPIELTDAYVHRVCAVGARILFERNTVGGHLAEIVNGQGRALTWLEGVLGGTTAAVPDGCVARDVAVNATDVSDGF